jgi:hypothetical protein
MSGGTSWAGFNKRSMTPWQRGNSRKRRKRGAEEDAKRAILPFYNKVMPILNEAKSDLDRAATEEPRIEINYHPNADFRRDPDTEFIFFQLRPNTGAPTVHIRSEP